MRIFNLRNQRNLVPYQSSKIECLTCSIFFVAEHVDVHNPKAIFYVSQGEEIVLLEKQLFQISADDHGTQIYVALKINNS